eukprot:CAMPEP_0113913932 /NCGR_PEP_ID=MMETSP0780_2-20120614/29955_1 /TAXON_ID=652834 /ORGANISM="Palpitomonas bilix" /LENGTH=246 /DNA_ID=CAMNT_0000911453 /DNA_START=1 /DNA_END=738 /DNA_ORIENTATION=- /assembly_acc=CAM_ASM_000599
MSDNTRKKVKEYAPTVFRQLRCRLPGCSTSVLAAAFGVEQLQHWTQLGALGRSGSQLWRCPTGAFMLKTVSKREAHTLLRCLPFFLSHVERTPHTLLSLPLCLWRVKTLARKGAKMTYYVVITPSVSLPGSRPTSVFDLKGSTVARRAREGDVVKKDLDLYQGFFKASSEEKLQLYLQIEKDVSLLRDLNLLDYSILVSSFKRGEEEGRHSHASTPFLFQPKFDSNTIVYSIGVIDVLTDFSVTKR